LFPLSCILSRQPARTTLRFAPSPPLRFGPAGVRSGTQPTVVVAKGKIANCRADARLFAHPKVLLHHPAEHRDRMAGEACGSMQAN